ncbi:MAG: MATE family efflux transporter [Planctomycetota bacterium]
MQTDVKLPQEPGEGRVLWHLALPLIFTNLTMFSMAAVDTLMIGHLSKDALAAMGIALVWLQGTTMFASGLLFGLDPIVSQAFGARNRERLNTVLGQGWILAMALTPVLALCWWYTEPFLIWSGQDPKLAAAGAQTARWLIPSAPF